MEPERIKSLNRIIFLKKFTEELLMVIVRRNRAEERISAGRVKQKLIPSLAGQNVNLSILDPGFRTKDSEEKKRKNFRRMSLPVARPMVRKPLVKPLTRPMQNQPPAKFDKPVREMTAPEKTTTFTQPVNNADPMSRINPILNDSSVQSIECPGPGKTLLIKRYNKINTTQIILTQQEIKSIINSFSERAMIPLAGGILKAAVGNVIISAVDSDFAGSRFIINKITPYSLIEK